MSENHVSIRIGGPIRESDLGDLADAISIDGVGFDWGDAAYMLPDQEIVGRLRETIAAEPHLNLFDDMCSGATMDHVEAFCREHGLQFVSTLDPNRGDEGQVRWWKPGMDQVETAVSDGDGVPLISATAIEEALVSPDPVQAVRALIPAVHGIVLPAVSLV